MARPSASVIGAGYRLKAGRYQRDLSYSCRRETGTADWLLLHTTAGRGRLTFANGGQQILGPGEAVLYRPGAFQDYATDRGSDGWEILWAHFLADNSWIDLLEWAEIAPGTLFFGSTDPLLAQALAQMVEDTTTDQPMADRLAYNSLERALLLYANHPQQANLRRLDPRIRAVLDLLEKHLSEPLTIAEVAQRVGLSASRLSHLFQGQMGVGLIGWRDQRRMQIACELLESTDDTISAIGRAVGYPEAAHFTHRFRRLLKQTPLQWRQRARRKNVQTPDDT
jgi:AraC family transcriptional regulator of arabinose operon